MKIGLCLALSAAFVLFAAYRGIVNSSQHTPSPIRLKGKTILLCPMQHTAAEQLAAQLEKELRRRGSGVRRDCNAPEVVVEANAYVHKGALEAASLVTWRVAIKMKGHLRELAVAEYCTLADFAIGSCKVPLGLVDDVLTYIEEVLTGRSALALRPAAF